MTHTWRRAYIRDFTVYEVLITYYYLRSWWNCDLFLLEFSFTVWQFFIRKGQLARSEWSHLLRIMLWNAKKLPYFSYSGIIASLKSVYIILNKLVKLGQTLAKVSSKNSYILFFNNLWIVYVKILCQQLGSILISTKGDMICSLYGSFKFSKVGGN